MDNIDDIFMADYKESMGLGTRFQFAEDMPVVEPEQSMFVMEDTGVDMGKIAEMVFVEQFKRVVDAMVYGTEGLAAGFAGLPGDVISLARGLYNMASDEEKSNMEKFIEGLDLPTGLPTSEDLKKSFRENVFEYQPQSQAFQEIPEAGEAFGIAGEVVAPATVVGKTVKASVKGAKKAKEALSKGAK